MREGSPFGTEQRAAQAPWPSAGRVTVQVAVTKARREITVGSFDAENGLVSTIRYGHKARHSVTKL